MNPAKRHRRKLLRLVRHYSVQVKLKFSRAHEFYSGLRSFVYWLPTLTANFQDVLRRENGSNIAEPQVSISSIPTVFINLESRNDRRQLIEKELHSMGFLNVQSFQAIPRSNGSLGCAESHIGALEYLADRPEHYFMICEDDLMFMSDRYTLEALLEEFSSRPRLDVLCVAYRLRAPRLPLSRTLALANSVQTAAGYVIRKRAIPALLQSFRESRDMLLAGESKSVASIDVHWKKIQSESLLFAIPTHRVARQRPSYSDIARELKDYGD